MDLLTRGAGFGYLGSTITSLVYASFTFIFFALEAAIMALALQMMLGLPLVWCYVLSAVVVIPLVTYGITLISRLQLWTQPIWLLLFALPFLYLALKNPHAYNMFTQHERQRLRQQRLRSADVRRRGHGRDLAGGPDRRAGRLPALPSGEEHAQSLALVGRGDARRARLGRARAC